MALPAHPLKWRAGGSYCANRCQLYTQLAEGQLVVEFRYADAVCELFPFRVG
jgi:hypothetical protein